MTFFGALGTAVSGVNAAATWIGNISDNVANATTTGYKVVDTSFSDLVHNKVLGESPVIDSTKHGGVLASANFQNRGQGGITKTTVGTNIAVSGQGFIPVERAVRLNSTTGAPTFDTQTYYTRAGDFQLTNTLNLANSAGYYLMAAPTGSTTPQLLTVDTAPLPAVPTSNIDYQANLPSNAATSTTFQNTVPMIDVNGNDGGLSLNWTNLGGNSWQLDISQTTDSNANEVANYGPYTFNFVNGLMNSVTDNSTVPPTTTTGPGSFSLTLDPTFGGTVTTNTDLSSVTLNLGSFDTTFDPTAASGLTQFATDNQNQSLLDFSQDGLKAGEFVNVSIDNLGNVNYNYTNGRSQSLFHVVLANFPEPDRLDRVDGTAFVESPASGTVVFGDAGDPTGTTGVGRFIGSAIESSTVDVAEEMTNLIQAQQAYGMNAQVITTADQMLSRAVDLKR